MALTNKLKFKENELVMDGATGYLGLISDYLGQGIYILSQVRAPFLDSRGNILGVMDVNLRNLRLGVRLPGSNDTKEVEGKYVQTSRYLVKANQPQIDQYNQLIVLPEDNQEYYLYDGYQNIYLLVKDKLYVKYRGGMCPFGYNLEARFNTYWSVNGNILNNEIRSVRKEDLREEAGARFSMGRLMKKSELNYVFDWEREYAPFVIEGRIL